MDFASARSAERYAPISRSDVFQGMIFRLSGWVVSRGA
jgi:hypothetical protein